MLGTVLFNSLSDGVPAAHSGFGLGGQLPVLAVQQSDLMRVSRNFATSMSRFGAFWYAVLERSL
jgi:hypothetical protein